MPEVEFEKGSSRGKCFLIWEITIILILLVIGASLAAYYLYWNQHDTKEEGGFCSTESCLKAAYEIVSSIDVSVDPCEDFYQFVCGSFMANAEERAIPSPVFVQTARKTKQLTAIVTQSVDDTDWEPLLLQRKFYQSCMNRTAIDDDENETVKEIIEALGGWPVLKGYAWKEQDFSVDEATIKSKILGVPFDWFFNIVYLASWKEIEIKVPESKFPFDDSFKQAVYLDLMIETAVELGASKIFATNDMTRTFAFEKQLAEIMRIHSASREKDMDADSLHSAYPIDWLYLLNSLTDDMNITVGDNDTINAVENYIRAVNVLLAKTPKRIQADYIIWKILQAFGYYLATPLRESFGNFTNLMKAEENQVNTRSEICVSEAIHRFPNIAVTAYIRKYVDEEKVKYLNEMVALMKEQMAIHLENSTWIDDSTKKLAINKVNNIIEIIGYHRLDFDEGTLDRFLNVKGLEFTSENIIDMIREKNINDFRLQFSFANVSVDFLTLSILEAAMAIDAFYMEILNIIDIPAALVQDSFYDLNRPNYLNYGGLGFIIGHEITHSLSTRADTHEDEEEMETMLSWYNETLSSIYETMFWNSSQLWQNDTLDLYNSHLSCAVDEYQNFLKEGNGSEALDENVADLIGINIAYEAYTKWVENNYEEDNLPGLPYTPQQLFWIQFGKTSCFKKVNSLDFDIRNDRHAATEYRVNTPAKNSEHFARDFECPAGTKMNPTYKCKIF